MLSGFPEPSSADYASYMVGVVALLVPLVGLLLGHRTIVGERASGEMTLLLSLPYDRLDVVVGKFLARAIALGTAVAVGILGGAALVNYPFGSFEAGTVAAYTLGTVLYGAAFVGVGLAVSTATTSTAVASSAAFGVFFLFVVVWSQLRGCSSPRSAISGWPTGGCRPGRCSSTAPSRGCCTAGSWTASSLAWSRDRISGRRPRGSSGSGSPQPCSSSGRSVPRRSATSAFARPTYDPEQ
ncbi:ABC transporter permease [Halolamina pelagica]|uniref:ABC transporter permease n=1 Tax=Halolamina pelagica TaxID=699431 RepID=UPI0006CAA412|nr:ABC transporter permease subunit [Halolamina pelagica]